MVACDLRHHARIPGRIPYQLDLDVGNARRRGADRGARRFDQRVGDWAGRRGHGHAHGDALGAPDDGAEEIAGRSRGTPRIANRLLRRVRDYAEVRCDGVVSRDVARAALELYEVDEHGLDRLDRAVLGALVSRFGGGPVWLSTLAVAVGEEAETVEVVRWITQAR